MVNAPVPAPREQAGILEYREVLRDGGQRHGEGPRELADRGVRRLRQAREDRPPRRIGEGGERRVEGGGTVNHMVNYIRERAAVKRPGRVYWSEKVLERNTAICPRVLDWFGQYSNGEAWQPPVMVRL